MSTRACRGVPCQSYCLLSRLILLHCCHVFWLCSAGGTVGMILTSLVTTVTANSAAIDGAFYNNWVELGKCLLVLVILVPWVFAATWACLFITDRLITLRVSGETHLGGHCVRAQRFFREAMLAANCTSFVLAQ